MTKRDKKKTLKIAKLWVQENLYKDRSTFNKGFTSYGLKHVVERLIGDYISNEDMNEIMEGCGFLSKRSPSGVNWNYQISKRQYDRFYEMSYDEKFKGKYRGGYNG